MQSDVDALRLLFAGAGVLLAGLSLPLIAGRVPPNGLYGFRVPATMDDPDLWYPANRFVGWRLLVTGISTAAAALACARIPGISLDGYAWACLAVFGLLFGLTIAQSFSYLGRLRRSKGTTDAPGRRADGDGADP